MNKRVGLFVLGILVLLGLSYGVYSNMTLIYTNGEFKVHQVNLPVSEGWNLIPALDTTPSHIAQNSDINLSSIVAAFVYIPENNRYYEYYPNGSELTKFLDSSPDYVADSPARKRLNMASVWLYVNKTGNIIYNHSNVPDSKNVPLRTGWNFVYITPDMEGKTLNSMNGNCSYRRAYIYQGNDWVSLLSNGAMDEVISTDVVGVGILVNVRQGCVMSKDPIVPPAQTCTDTDEGDDQNTKGTVRVSLSGAVTSYTDSCSGNVLTEYYCNANINLSKQYTCANGCSNGACLPTPPVVPTCTETDGGLNYALKGNLTITGVEGLSGTIFEDYCIGNKLIERYCSDFASDHNKFTKEYNCQYGCSDGACWTSPTPPSLPNLDDLLLGMNCSKILPIQIESGYGYPLISSSNITDNCASTNSGKEVCVDVCLGYYSSNLGDTAYVELVNITQGSVSDYKTIMQEGGVFEYNKFAQGYSSIYYMGDLGEYRWFTNKASKGINEVGVLLGGGATGYTMASFATIKFKTLYPGEAVI